MHAFSHPLQRSLRNTSRESLSGQKGIVIGGEVVNNIRYADDTVIIAENLVDLQELVNRVNEACKNWGLSINLNKTKYMVVSKVDVGETSLLLNEETLERVAEFKYLRS